MTKRSPISGAKYRGHRCKQCGERETKARHISNRGLCPDCSFARWQAMTAVQIELSRQMRAGIVPGLAGEPATGAS